MKKILLLSLIWSVFSVEETYDPKNFYGIVKKDDMGNILHIEENPSQTHGKEEYVLIRVKNIKIDPAELETSRVRIAVWDKPEFYAKEGQKPFRAISTWSRDNKNGEIVFKVGGLIKGQPYSYFAHLDKKNTGKVARNFLGLPTEPYIFSNGLKRAGFGPPIFNKTLIKYERPAQEIILSF